MVVDFLVSVWAQRLDLNPATTTTGAEAFHSYLNNDMHTQPGQIWLVHTRQRSPRGASFSPSVILACLSLDVKRALVG